MIIHIELYDMIVVESFGGSVWVLYINAPKQLVPRFDDLHLDGLLDPESCHADSI